MDKMSKKSLIEYIKTYKKLTGESSPGLCKIKKDKVIKYIKENKVFETLEKELNNTLIDDSSDDGDLKEPEEIIELNDDLLDEKEELEIKKKEIIDELKYSIREMDLDLDYMRLNNIDITDINELEEQKKNYQDNINKIKSGILHPNDIIIS